MLTSGFVIIYVLAVICSGRCNHISLSIKLLCLFLGDFNLKSFSQERLQYVKDKLNGRNPSHITSQEVGLVHGKKDVCPYFQQVALGDKVKNIRAQLPDYGLNSRQQVSQNSSLDMTA